MQLKQPIKSFFAILLVVIFSLQAGAGLYLHNTLHVKNYHCESSAASTKIKLACSCFTDFNLPYTESPTQKTLQPPLIYQDHIYAFISLTPFTFPVFHSLRAPPIHF